MSQEQPPQDPAIPPSQPPVPEAFPPEDAVELETAPPSSPPPAAPKILQTVQQVWSEAKPALKAQTIKLLRATIQRLETTLDWLEAEPSAIAASKPSPIAEFASRLPRVNLEKVQQTVLPIWEQIQRWWETVLPQVRSRLPVSMQQQLSDRALTGAIAGILVILLWFTSGLLSGKPKPPVIATSPSAAPAIPPIVSPSPSPLPSLAPTITITPSPVQPSPKPKPALKLTPQEQLIAAIQTQVADISDQYASGLIRSVQANFRSSRLIVKVGDEWYQFSRVQQDKLANELLRRSQRLDFSQLQLTDPVGTLLARNPVVGTEMVILQRESEKVAG